MLIIYSCHAIYCCIYSCILLSFFTYLAWHGPNLQPASPGDGLRPTDAGPPPRPSLFAEVGLRKSPNFPWFFAGKNGLTHKTRLPFWAKKNKRFLCNKNGLLNSFEIRIPTVGMLTNGLPFFCREGKPSSVL